MQNMFSNYNGIKIGLNNKEISKTSLQYLIIKQQLDSF